MIHKSFIFSTLFLSTQMLLAGSSLATIKYGLTSIDNDGGMHFKKHSFRVDGLFDIEYDIKPRVGLAYINIDESKADGGVSSAIQLDAEGVYELETRYLLTPYAFSGLGYEYIVDSRPNFDSQFYIDGGIGLRYPFEKNINFVTEFKALHILKSKSKQDAEFSFYIGVGIPFGKTSVAKDSDRDTIFDYADMCPNTPLGTQVGLDGCALTTKQTGLTYQDTDGDSIPDKIDICPNTPAGTGVNDRGCPVRKSVQAKRYYPASTTPQTATTTDDTIPILETEAISTQQQVTKKPAITIVHTQPLQYEQEVIMSKEELPTSITPVERVEESIIQDKDEDGVADVQDQCQDTPKGFIVNDIGCAQKKDLNVRFEPNSSVVTASSKRGIQDFSKFIKRYPNAKINIVGYTDNSGNREKNIIISEKRAQQVKQLLSKYGVDTSKMTAIGKGDVNPIATNETAEGRETNRRVEVEIK